MDKAIGRKISRDAADAFMTIARRPKGLSKKARRSRNAALRSVAWTLREPLDDGAKYAQPVNYGAVAAAQDTACPICRGDDLGRLNCPLCTAATTAVFGGHRPNTTQETASMDAHFSTSDTPGGRAAERIFKEVFGGRGGPNDQRWHELAMIAKEIAWPRDFESAELIDRALRDAADLFPLEGQFPQERPESAVGAFIDALRQALRDYGFLPHARNEGR
jgi:hypothetical protein